MTILIQQSDNGNKYFSLSYLPNQNDPDSLSSINLYLNIDNDNVPSGTFIYDFYNTGEIFYNNTLPASGSSDIIDIVSAKDIFRKFYQRTFAIAGFNSDLLNLHITNTVSKANSITLGQSHFCDKYSGYIFSISEFFDYNVVNNPSPTKTYIPVCANYTFVNENYSVISQNYPYANTINGVTNCSHYTTLKTPYTNHPCSFVDHAACPHYLPSEEVLFSKIIKSNYSDSEQNISLTTFTTFDKVTVYRIYNHTVSSIICDLTYPYSSDADTNEQKSHAIDVYNEIVSVYDSHTFTDVEQVDSSQSRTSYLSALVSLN